MADDERPFRITVRRPWKLFILPALATLYFLAVVILNALNYRIRGVSFDLLVYIGLGLFALVILIELPFFMRQRPPRAAPAPKARAAAVEPMADGRIDDDELLTTSESQQGLQVIEYSAPAKSRNANAVFTKTYVPVTGAHVLRVETLVADQSDL